MTTELQCPRLPELEAFVLGQVGGEESLRIKSHLDACQACRAVFQHLSETTLSKPGKVRKVPVDPTSAGEEFTEEPEEFPFLLPAVQPDEIGRLGSYRVMRLLGRGGMGIVFHAEDIALHRPVALKVMRPEMKGDRDGWQRFLQEARAMAAIKHEHLVTVFWAGQENDVVFFAMELLEGESLESWMKDAPSPDVAEIVRLAREITSGLAFLHRQGLLHRDIKPANIWLEAPNRRVKILDLGLVLRTTADARLTMSGTVLGTPAFMSPEQARGDPVDARTDLFSLGCILYCLCTGRRPFQGETASAIFMALASETPPVARELNPQVPESLSNLVMLLLARNPKKRPASAEVVLQALEKIEQEINQPVDRTEPIKVAKRPKSTARKEKPRKTSDAKTQQPVLLLAVGLTILVLLGFVAGYLLLEFPIWRRPGPVGKPADPGNPLAADKTYLTELKEVAKEHFPFRKGPPDGDPGKEFKKKKPKDKDKDKDKGKEFDMRVMYQGKVWPHSIFMHPPAPPFVGQPASLTYSLGKQYQTFQAEVSLNDDQESETPCTFWVYGDGKELWKSNPVTTQQDTQKCNVSVKNVDQLKLMVTCPGLPHGAHAIWIDPVVSK